MDIEFIVMIAPLIVGSVTWQISARHIASYLQTFDEDHVPPGALSKLFVGPLFTTLPMIPRYRMFREMHDRPPYGVWGFYGGLVLTVGGLLFFFAVLTGR